MKDKKVLIVEDDKKIADLLYDYLIMAGFNVSVLNQGDGVTAEVKNNPPDLIILDIMLPGKDGISICGEIRSFSKVPIVICTAKIDEIDRVLGLEIGADDYICKPFSPREVVARVKAVLRRLVNNQDEQMMIIGPIIIKPGSHNATIFDKQLNLTPVEFELLKILANHPHKVFGRNDLISNLKMCDPACNVRVIDSHMKNLRKKIEGVSPGANIIRTVYGIGYSFEVSSDTLS
jgi:two-component system, OmpR family, response regulator BaeR